MPKFSADVEKPTPSTDGQTPDTAHLLEQKPGQRYLEKGVEKADGLVSSDEKLRKDVDPYGT